MDRTIEVPGIRRDVELGSTLGQVAMVLWSEDVPATAFHMELAESNFQW